MDPLDVGGVLAEGLDKQAAQEADHAAVDNQEAELEQQQQQAGDAAAPKPDDGEGDAAPAAPDADGAADAAAAQTAAAHADFAADDIPYQRLPMPEAEVAALGQRAAERAHALSNAEASLLLASFARQERAANASFEPTAAAQRAARYAERMGGSRNTDAVVRMRE
jgi:hypothetical protein